MMAALYNHISDLPEKWCHNTLKNNYDETVAMIVARNGHISDLSDKWYHDPTLKNKYGLTVAMIAILGKCI